MSGQDLKKKDTSKHRVITMLERPEMEFLDKIGKDSLFSTGHKLSYNEILKGLIDVAMESGVSGEKVDSLDSFKSRVFQEMQKKLEEKLSKVDFSALLKENKPHNHKEENK
jgi:hypothetical protein